MYYIRKTSTNASIKILICYKATNLKIYLEVLYLSFKIPKYN